MLARTTETANVLIVDDDPLALELLAGVLGPEGYQISRATDGVEALALLGDANKQYDLVITDRGMPKLDGLQLVARIKQDKRLKNIPIILQTGLVCTDEVIEGVRAGVFYYLAKPYSARMLLSVVASAIADHTHYASLRTELTGQTLAMTLLRQGEFFLRTPREARQLSILLATLFPSPETAVIGISELMLNAVEHGNLEISYAEKGDLLTSGRWEEEIESRLRLPRYRERKVRVEISRDDCEVCLSIIDQGPGFDPAAYLQIDPSRATHPHGRGIAMARMMSFDAMNFKPPGNRVDVVSRFL